MSVCRAVYVHLSIHPHFLSTQFISSKHRWKRWYVTYLLAKNAYQRGMTLAELLGGKWVEKQEKVSDRQLLFWLKWETHIENILKAINAISHPCGGLEAY